MSSSDFPRDSGTESSDSDNQVQFVEGESGQTLVRAKPYQVPETLERLYWDDGLSQTEIAEHFDVDQSTISREMDKHGIETRPDAVERITESVENRGNDSDNDGSIYRTVKESGTVWYCLYDPNSEDDGSTWGISEHQLVALLEHDPYDVFADETVVHHELAAPVAVNVAANLDVIGATEHLHIHGGRYDPDTEEILSHFDGFADVDGERLDGGE
jgi:predicted XRE-type DNA-binding protein